ncbi:hypothetical protein TNCV_749741 [Trichonephila clavipes]|nr:hypothetical protein TNCV_749741 [Trichonephila clavipes]
MKLEIMNIYLTEGGVDITDEMLLLLPMPPDRQRENNPGGGQTPPTALTFPPTSRENLWLDGYLKVPPCREGTIHLQTSMSFPGSQRQSSQRR